MRTFEKTADGLLVEVPETAAGGGRTHSVVSMVACVLWTPEEEAARAAEQAAYEAQRVTAAQAEQARLDALGKHRKQVEKKLEKLGLTLEDMDALRG